MEGYWRCTNGRGAQGMVQRWRETCLQSGILGEEGDSESSARMHACKRQIITIRLAGKPFKMTIIQIYAPSTDRHEEEVDEFYEDLKKIMKKVPHKDVLVIQGGWNAKIGEDANESWSGTVGKFALGTANDRGERLLQFAKTHQLVAANTLFKHQLSRRAI